MIEYKGSWIKIIACCSCNSACRHCYINDMGKRTPDELYDMAKNLRSRYTIRIDGSELLTNYEYLKTIKLVGQTNICTNGKVFLNDSKNAIRNLKTYNINELYISYHIGIHDEYCELKSNEVERAIKLLLDNNFKVGIMTTITQKNINSLDYICNKAQELGVSSVQFNRLILQGKAKVNNLQSEIVTTDQLKGYYDEFNLLYNKYDANGLKLDSGKAFERSEDFKCRSINGKVWIAPNNKVYPCVFLVEKGREIGEYVDGKVMLYNQYKNNGRKCIAHAACNHRFLV